jgi:hypothetical protein
MAVVACAREAGRPSRDVILHPGRKLMNVVACLESSAYALLMS